MRKKEGKRAVKQNEGIFFFKRRQEGVKKDNVIEKMTKKITGRQTKGRQEVGIKKEKCKDEEKVVSRR